MNINVMRINWLILAASLPLFSVSFARINMGIYHIPVPALALAGILVLTLLKSSLKGSVLSSNFRGLYHYRILFALTVLIFLIHGISVFQSCSPENALREFVKIGAGIVTFWFVVLFFPMDPKFLQVFLKLSVGATTILLLVLLYYYGILLKAPYLGTLYSRELTPNGKSHLAWFLILLVPYCLAPLFEKKISLFWLIANTLIGLSIIYAMSRASWIVLLFILCLFGFFAIKDHLHLNVKMTVLLLATTSISLGFLVYHANLGDWLSLRIQSVYSPASLPDTHEAVLSGKYSRQSRMMLASGALSKFRDHPWFGGGLASSAYENGMFDPEVITHNDYLSLLAETGLAGTIPFLIFLVLLAKRLLNNGTNPKKSYLSRATQMSFMAILFLSNFINTYTSVHYWFFLALALKINEICIMPSERLDQIVT